MKNQILHFCIAHHLLFLCIFLVNLRSTNVTGLSPREFCQENIVWSGANYISLTLQDIQSAIICIENIS